MATKARIIQIGNSRGIRVPKALLEQADLPEEVELHAEPGRLVVRAARRPRAGWGGAARGMGGRSGGPRPGEAAPPGGVEWHGGPGGLVVGAARRPRAGWGAAARVMRERSEDTLL